MAHSWADKFRNALEGTVDGSDALARLAATTQLSGFRAQLADRRLEAQIAWVAEPWRVPIAIAPIAAPVWLADWLVTLAQSLVEAEANAHPERSTAMAPLTRGQVLALLDPVETLLSELSGMLVDPHRRSTFNLPMLLKPYTRATTGLQTERIPVPYVRGLLAGASSVAGSVQTLAADYQVFFADSTAPDLLRSGMSGLRGDLADSQSRLDACDIRVSAFSRGQSPEDAALRDLSLELWAVTTAVFSSGQLLAAPTLLPGVASKLAGARQLEQPPRPSAPSGEIAARPAEAEAVPRPPLPEPPVLPRALPDIAIRPGAAPLSHAQVPAEPPSMEAPRRMPEIGGSSGTVSLDTPRPSQRPAADQRPGEGVVARAMPQIGAPGGPARPTERMSSGGMSNTCSVE